MKMKQILPIILALFLTAPTICHARDIALYNYQGEAVAYIDTESDLTIYLWGGEPVAYLDGHSIYGFNGMHLGWFEDGIVWDHNGNVVGFVEGAVNVTTQIQPIKGVQNISPIRSIEEIEPIEPVHTNRWARISFAIFLSMGRS